MTRTTTEMKEMWIDNVKAIACLLVVLGHFFQSLVKADILAESTVYLWFEQAIYLFHVPLFFICSGYLYQKNSKVNSLKSWRKNVWKKLIALGVPYFTFSIITWALKIIFSGSVNDEVFALGEALFLNPLSPYWYLYVLFFNFVVTPTFSRKKMCYFGLGIALIARIYSMIVGGSAIYAVSQIMLNEIWFITGMYLCMDGVKFKGRGKELLRKGVILLGGFLSINIVFFCCKINISIVNFLMGMIACIGIILISISVSDHGRSIKIWNCIRKYTFSVFLMHTIFAAPVRIVLLKLGIQNFIIHIVLGLTASIVGPILAENVMKKTGWMDFVLYPTKYIKLNQ